MIAISPTWSKYIYTIQCCCCRCSYNARRIYSHAFIHKTKVVCKILFPFCIDACKSHYIRLRYKQFSTNKNQFISFHFISYHLKIERIQHTNVTISLHHFNCLFMIFTYFIFVCTRCTLIHYCLFICLLLNRNILDLLLDKCENANDII